MEWIAAVHSWPQAIVAIAVIVAIVCAIWVLSRAL